MAEKVDDPLRGLYRQLGIPLAGEGDFADVKPNTVIRPWPGPFEQVREVFDPEYSAAKKLATTQQGMMEDFVRVANAFKAQQSTQVPTVGDAQTLFPGHKELIPEQAYKAIPQSPLQAEDMPVMTGMQQQVIPDTRFQGPMPGVMTPLGQQNANLIDAWKPGIEPFPLNAQDRTGMAQQTGEFVQEGPRPMRTVTTGVYGPDTAPSQSIELDKSMKLPLAFQAQLGAMQHALSTRQPQVHYPSAEEQKLDMGMKLGLQAWQEANPGKPITAAVENDIFTQVTGGYNKTDKPGSIGERKANADARMAEITADLAHPKGMAEIGNIEAQMRHHDEQVNELQTLLQAKLAKLEAEARAANAVGSKESIGAYYKEQQALLGRAKAMMEIAIEGRKGKTIDEKSYAKLIDLALADLDTGVKAEAKQRTWWEEHFGPDKAVEVTPRPSEEPARRLVPPGIPQVAPSTVPPMQPTRPAEPEIEDKAAKQAFGRTLKDGETKVFKGKKYMRKGNQLIEVQ